MVLSISATAFAVGVETEEEIEEFEEVSIYGYLPEKDNWSMSLPMYTQTTRTATVLPSSHDNSTSQFFPAIGDQGGIGSCAAFANAYYQYTYEVNKFNNTPTTPENTFCPQWIYVHRENYSGMRPEEAYEILSIMGGLRCGDYTAYEHDHNNCTTEDEAFYDYYCDNTNAKYDAFDVKAEPCAVARIKTKDTSGNDLPVITFGTGLETDNAFDPIKEAIADGKIVTFSCNFEMGIGNASNLGTHSGEKIAYRVSHPAYNIRNTKHRLAIVGYDDNICFDCNGDGVIEEAEKGAFKIANSWGTTARNHNSGYIWVLYDVFNTNTQNSDETWDDSTMYLRGEFLTSDVADNEGRYNVFTCITIYEYEPMFLVEVIVDTDNFYDLSILPYRSDVNKTLGNKREYRYIDDFNAFSYTGSIIVDTFDLFELGADFHNNVRFGTYLYYSDKNSHNIVSISIKDSNENLVAQVPIFPLLNVSGNTISLGISMVANVYFEHGDLNYDNKFTSMDCLVFGRYLSGTVSLSKFQKHLADINEDGIISTDDLTELERILAGKDQSVVNDLTREEQELYLSLVHNLSCIK